MPLFIFLKQWIVQVTVRINTFISNRMRIVMGTNVRKLIINWIAILWFILSSERVPKIQVPLATCQVCVLPRASLLSQKRLNFSLHSLEALVLPFFDGLNLDSTFSFRLQWIVVVAPPPHIPHAKFIPPPPAPYTQVNLEPPPLLPPAPPFKIQPSLINAGREWLGSLFEFTINPTMICNIVYWYAGEWQKVVCSEL